MKRLLFFLLIFIFVIQQIVVLPGCANIIPPSGGPRDSLPPRLLKASPPDSTTNYSGNKILFSFDEYVELDNIQSNLLVSPTPNTQPVVDYRLNTITVKLADVLESNTTYSLNFGNAIKDFNEGNVLKGFTYIFSTGPAIDSLRFSGKVLLAETGKTDSTLIVILHKSSDDSAVVKNRPNYMARLDGNGNFVFSNMPPGTFYVYALQDQAGNHRYLDSKQLFAFADSAINISQQTTPVTLYAYDENQKPEPLVSGLRSRSGIAENRLKYKTTVINGMQDILEIFSFSFEQPLKNFDASRIRFTVDSTFTDVKNYSWEKDSTGKIVRLKYQWKENTMYHVLLEKDFATDTSGRSLLKPDTLTFRTKKQIEYGTLNIVFRNLNLSLHPVLQLIQANEIKKSIPLTTTSITEPLFPPGDYELRILYDRNNNGKWDAGNFFGELRQPEIAKPVERKISVKANHLNEFEIAL